MSDVGGAGRDGSSDEHPQYERVRTLTPQVSVLLQRNPGPMTLEGTNTWLLHSAPSPVGDSAGGGFGQVIVVDPGESDDTHLEALLAAAPDIALVLVTHGHHDHVQAAAAVHERTGAPVRAFDPAHCLGAGPLVDGEAVSGAGVHLRVLATPGHTSDSVCFVLDGTDGAGGAAVLTGDSVLGRGTTVVAHPDGVLGPYLKSLQRLRDLGPLPVFPGHGPELPAVDVVAGHYLEHREQRLRQVRAALHELGPDTSARQIVERVYADVDEAVWWAAELSVAAQLDYLRAQPPPA